MNKLEEIILKTLSFYRPLTLTQLLLEMEQTEIESLSHLTMTDLKRKLNTLEFRGAIKLMNNDKGEPSWLRIFPRRKSWWEKIKLIQ